MINVNLQFRKEKDKLNILTRNIQETIIMCYILNVGVGPPQFALLSICLIGAMTAVGVGGGGGFSH